jgi:cold shock CspA family protein
VERSEQVAIIRRVISSLPQDSDSWVKIAALGGPLKNEGLDYKRLGHDKLRYYLTDFTDILEIRAEKDGSKAPVIYVRLIGDILAAAEMQLSGNAGSTADVQRREGIIQRYIRDKGFGFFEDDIFFHIRDVRNGDSYFFSLRTHQYTASFEVEESSSKPGTFVAKNVEILSANSKDNISAVEKKPSRDSNINLTDWATISNYASTLNTLKALALEENWYYGEVPPSNGFLPILDNYLKFTFKRIVAENKIEYGTDSSTNSEYSAFNTGLVDSKYEDIYALFEKCEGKYLDASPPWHLKNFTVAGEGYDGKLLTRAFNPLPKRAQYFTDIKHMLYDQETGDLTCDLEHIIADRTFRLPYSFIKTNCPNNFTLIDNDDIDSIREKEKEAQIEYFNKLGRKIREDSYVYNAFVNRLKDAIALAKKRVVWNYKTAIPMYFPGRNTGSLLLPLSLLDEKNVDLALVVERNPNGSYQGHTVITLEMAHNNARLVTRPDSDWLNTKVRTDDLKLGDADT